MEHRRDNHEMPLCRYDLDGGCNRPTGKCWYKHKSSQSLIITNIEQIICYTCKEEFRTIGVIMEHRKLNLPEVVKKCSDFMKGQCKQVKCWFLHENSGDNSEIEQVFQATRKHQESP